MRNQHPELNTFENSTETDLCSLFLDNSEEILLLIDKDLRILTFNKQAEQYVKNGTGVSLSKGISVFDFAPAEMHNRLQGVFKEALQGKHITFEDQAQLGGAPLYFSSTLRPAYDAAGQIIGLISISRDITEKKMAELESANSRKNLDLLLDNTDESFIMLDKDWKVILFNKMAFLSVEVYFNIELHLGFPFLELIQPHRRQLITGILQSAFKGQPQEIEMPLNFKGNPVFIANKYKPVFNENREVVAVIITSNDATQKRLDEQILKDAEERWRFALEGGNQGVWDWNMKTNEVFFSPSFKRLYGFAEDDLQNTYQQWRDRVHPEDTGKIENAIEKHSGSENPYYESVYRFRAKNGEYKWILARGMIVSKAADGSPERMIGTHTDITETKSAEDTYRLLFFSHPSPMWVYDLKTLAILEVNDAAVRHYGYSRDEFLQLRIEDLRDKGEIKLLSQIISEVKKNSNTRKDIARHVKKNGEVIHVEVTGNAFDYNGRKSRLVTINDITEKVEAENRLKLSEQHYKTLFQNNPLPCWIYDQNDLRLLEVNEAAVAHYGYSRDEFLSMNAFDLQPEDQLLRLRERVFREKEGSIIEETNWKHRKKNGDIIYVDLKSSSITHNGNTARLIVAHDVTPKVLIEEELRRSNERFTYVSKATSDAVYDWNIETNIIHWGDGLYSLFGYTSEELSMPNWEQLLHPEERQQVLEILWATLENPQKKIWKAEYRLKKADGSYSHVLERGFIIRNSNGKAVRLVGSLQDISELKKQEEELRVINERYAYVTKATSDAVYDWNLQSNELHWGEGMNTLFGHNPKSVTIENWETLIHPDDRKWVTESLGFVIEKSRRKFWKEQYRFQNADGSYSYVLDKGFVLRDRNGSPLRMIGAMQDITELKEKEKELIRSNDRYHYAALATSDIIWDWNLRTDEILWSDNMYKVLGWELPADRKVQHSLYFSHVHPEDSDRVNKSLKAFQNDPARNHWTEEYRYQRADGSYAYIINKAHIIRSKSGEPVRMIGAMQDISEKHYNDALISLEKSIYELSADKSIPLTEVLNSLLKGIEVLHPEAFTSILLLREDDTIEQIASPRIPLGFKQAIDGAKIGPNEGSCGAAMHTRQTIIVEDIDTHPLWVNFKGLAAQFDLKACWSLPIINSSGTVMGSFAIYYKSIKAPTQKELFAIERVRNIIRVLMENHFSLLEIETANERFDAVLQATHDLIWDWDLEKNVIYRDRVGLEKVFGTTQDEHFRHIDEWLTRIHPEDQKNVREKLEEMQLSADQETFEIEYRFRRDDGTYTFVYDRGIAVRNAEGKAVRMIGAAQDITERKRLEQILIQKELERQKAINQATVETQEQERGEIGKELHDNVNQVLTTTKLYLDLALSNPEMKDELVQKSVKNIVNVINEIRQLSRSLMDPSIGDLGLIDSIHDLVNNINLTRKLHVTLQAGEGIDQVLTKNQKLTIFRIIQEALNNAIRHAKATTVDVHIQRLEGSIRMDIRDDGIGFNPQKTKKGAGLKNIQNRVYLIDGTHSIQSEPEKGCTIRIEFPITENF